ARDARRALAASEENPPELLPADDHRDGGRDLRGDGREGCEERQARAAARRMNPQLKGVEKLEGTYLFDLKTSAKALRLNRFLHGLTVPASRDAFKANQEAAFEKAGLTAEERRMVRELDWAALMRYGASFFCLEKLARVRGVSNPEMVAGFRGE